MFLTLVDGRLLNLWQATLADPPDVASDTIRVRMACGEHLLLHGKDAAAFVELATRHGARIKSDEEIAQGKIITPPGGVSLQ